MTEFFTTLQPDECLEELLAYFQEKGYKAIAADDKYKVKLGITNDKGDLLNEAIVKVTKADHDKYAVEFQRISGDCMEFIKQYN